MFRALYGALSVGFPRDSLTANAFIESFFLHARNVIAFLKNDTDCGFDTRYFTVNTFNPNTNFVPAMLWRKINHHIAHLLPERTSDPMGKLGPADRTQINKLIEAELARFENVLTDEYKPKWKPNPPFSDTIAVTATTSATNHVIVVSADSTTAVGPYKFLKITGLNEE